MDTRELEKRLKSEFEKVIDNPSDKRVKRYREVEEAVLVLWARELYSDLVAGINNSIQAGKTKAIAQLRKKGFKKTIDNSQIYQQVADAKKQQLKVELERLVATIKLNSRRNISELRNAFILEKKRLAENFLSTFRKYGVAFFVDRGGARWTLDRYVSMLSQTTLYNAEREAFFAKSVEWGNDLVKVVHVGDEQPCPLCQPFQGKVLSITGSTRGYMSISEAENLGLNHINCYDVYELAPEEIADSDKEIEPNQENLKYEARLK